MTLAGPTSTLIKSSDPFTPTQAMHLGLSCDAIGMQLTLLELAQQGFELTISGFSQLLKKLKLKGSDREAIRSIWDKLEQVGYLHRFNVGKIGFKDCVRTVISPTPITREIAESAMMTSLPVVCQDDGKTAMVSRDTVVNPRCQGGGKTATIRLNPSNPIDTIEEEYRKQLSPSGGKKPPPRIISTIRRNPPLTPQGGNCLAADIQKPSANSDVKINSFTSASSTQTPKKEMIMLPSPFAPQEDDAFVPGEPVQPTLVGFPDEVTQRRKSKAIAKKGEDLVFCEAVKEIWNSEAPAAWPRVRVVAPARAKKWVQLRTGYEDGNEALEAFTAALKAASVDPFWSKISYTIDNWIGRYRTEQFAEKAIADSSNTSLPLSQEQIDIIQAAKERPDLFVKAVAHESRVKIDFTHIAKQCFGKDSSYIATLNSLRIDINALDERIADQGLDARA